MSDHRAAPAVAGVDVGLEVEEHSHDVAVALAGGDVERGAAVEVDAVDVDAAVEQLLDAPGVALARQEEQLHGGVQVVRHGQVRRQLLVVRADGALAPPAAPVRVHGRLPPEQEPGRGRGAARARGRLQRGRRCLTPQLPAAVLPPGRGARRHLPLQRHPHPALHLRLIERTELDRDIAAPAPAF